MANTYKFKGHIFYTEEELNEAKKEAEAVQYLRARTNFDDAAMAAKVYNKAVDRNMMTTVIGLDFLKELRAAALKSNVINEKELRNLPEITKSSRKNAKKKKKPEGVELLQRKIVGQRVVIAGLVIIIAGMFYIVMTGRLTPATYLYEEEVLNKYADWAQELEKQQQSVNDKLYFLEQNGIYYEEKEE